MTTLTRDQIEVDDTYYGVPVASLTDGTLLVLTDDPRRATAALSRYVREWCSQSLRDYLGLCPAGCDGPQCRWHGCSTLSLWQVRAIFRALSADGWQVELVDDHAPGSIPIMVVG